jgi:hypothetical protein
MDMSGNLISMEISKISKLVKFNKFFRYRVDSNKKFKVKVAYYKAFLFVIRGSK